MLRLRSLFAAACLLASACGGKPKTTPEPSAHALSGLAAQHVAVLPTYMVRLVPGLAWSSAMGRPADVKTTLDADIVAAFEERGIRKAWLFPAELTASYKRNASYAADPYGLAEEPLRSPSLAVETRLPEPLASQIRTLVALHDEVRFVLAPVEMRVEPSGTSGAGRGVLRVVLLDARLSNVKWIGEIRSDSLPAYSPAITAGIAAKLADVVSAQ